jgi:hypothetical protein
LNFPSSRRNFATNERKIAAVMMEKAMRVLSMRGVIVLASGLHLAACSSAVEQVSYTEVRSAYSFGEAGYAADGRDLWTVIQGDPFRMMDSSFADTVTSLMHSPLRTRFTTQPGESAIKLYRVVLRFGAEPGVSPPICGAATPTFDTAARPVRVHAAFCRGEQILTEAVGFVNANAASDPAFRTNVAAVSRELFPLRDQLRDSRRGCIGMGKC